VCERGLFDMVFFADLIFISDTYNNRIREVVQAARPRPVKVILETGALTRDEKVIGCALAKAAGADYVKTSTGFGPGGATAADVALMRRVARLLHDRVELDRVYLAWPTVPQFHEDDAPLLLLADILARGKSSRLYRKLVVELELAQDVSAYQSGRELAGSFGVTVTLRPGRPRARARDLVDAELAAIAESGVSDEELARARDGRLAGFIYALETIGGFGGVADRLNAYNTYLGDPGRITSDAAPDISPIAVCFPRPIRSSASGSGASRSAPRASFSGWSRTSSCAQLGAVGRW